MRGNVFKLIIEPGKFNKNLLLKHIQDMDTLLGYDFPTTWLSSNFHWLETCAARRKKGISVSYNNTMKIKYITGMVATDNVWDIIAMDAPVFVSPPYAAG